MDKEKLEMIKEKQAFMNITLSSADKKFLEVYAAEHDTTVAAVIADYVE